MLTDCLNYDKIKQLQDLMLLDRCEMPEAEHIFCPGVYARKFEMPSGMIVVGKIHKHQHLMIVLSGLAEVVTNGEGKTVKGGDVFVSQAGAKRAVRAIEKTVFLTIHHNPSDSESLEDIESEHIEDEGFKIDFHKKAEGGSICHGVS